jgi:uncharacterized protein (DUF433 family)
MTEYTLRVFVRVISRRLAHGETLDEILASYPNLTDEDKKQIREALK